MDKIPQNENRKIWVTKHALTSGIKEFEAVVHPDPKRGMAVYKNNGYDNYVHGDEFHLDRVSAVAKAESMRLKKIESLDKKIRKLKKMKFA